MTSSKRPKRTIIQKKLEYNEGMLWQEERDLRKALYASLHPGRLKMSDDEDGDEEFPNNYQAQNYDAASCTSTRTVTSAPSTPIVNINSALGMPSVFSTSAHVTPTTGSISVSISPTLAIKKTPTSTSDDEVTRTIERVIRNGIKASAAAEAARAAVKAKKHSGDGVKTSAAKVTVKNKKHACNIVKPSAVTEATKSAVKGKKHACDGVKSLAVTETVKISVKAKKVACDCSKASAVTATIKAAIKAKKHACDGVKSLAVTETVKTAVKAKKVACDCSKASVVTSTVKAAIKAKKHACDGVKSLAVTETVKTVVKAKKVACDCSKASAVTANVKTAVKAKKHACDGIKSLAVTETVKTAVNAKKHACDSVKSSAVTETVKTAVKAKKHACDSVKSSAVTETVKIAVKAKKVACDGNKAVKAVKDTTKTAVKTKKPTYDKQKEKVKHKDKVRHKEKKKEKQKEKLKKEQGSKAREKQKEKARQKLKERWSKQQKLTKEKIVKKIRRRRMKDRKCKIKGMVARRCMITRSRDLNMQRIEDEEKREKIVLESIRTKQAREKKTMVQRRRESMAEVLLRKRITRSKQQHNDAAINTTSGTQGLKMTLSTALKTKKPLGLKAQRKFAQSLPSSPSTTPLHTTCGGSGGILFNYCPKTEDFLTFLCLRDSPALPPHLDLFGISEQIQSKGEPDFPSDMDDIRIPGVEPLPADRPGSPASSMTTEEESATESCSCEKGAIRARAPYNARGTAKPCSSEVHRRTLAPPCLTPVPPPIAAVPQSQYPPALICMVPGTESSKPSQTMPIKRPNSLHTRGPNNRQLAAPSAQKMDQNQFPTSKERKHKVITNGVNEKKLRKERKKQRKEKKLVNNKHHKTNNVVVRKLKRKRKRVDYAEDSSSDSIDGVEKVKKKRKLRKCNKLDVDVETNFKNHKQNTLDLLEKVVRNKHIRLKDFTRKSSIKLLRNSKLLLKGKMRENMKITVNSFSESTVNNNYTHKSNNIMDDHLDFIDTLELPNTQTNHYDNHKITHNALQHDQAAQEKRRGRGRPPGSKNKPKVPNAVKLKRIINKKTTSVANSNSPHNSNCKVVPNLAMSVENEMIPSSTSIQSAPVFYPTSEEWRDPMEYINSIAAQVEPCGMCKVIPPKGWRPECKVNDDMRFSPQVQYIHRLRHRWGSNVQELACIKKHIAGQDYNLIQSPQIGGCELDLVNFSQVVTQQGGLKTITSKKKWNKVADQLKMPKMIQNRVSKLDSIYCKYLLSYDTLSQEEKDKLLGDVEAERKHNAMRKTSKHLKWSSSECEVTKTRPWSLVQFCRTANFTRQMHFKKDPLPAEVETDYWRIVEKGQNHVAVHKASLDTSVSGRHNWNLNNVSNNSCNILHVLPSRMAITVPQLKLGMLYSTESWNCDRHSLPSIEYLHTGAPKVWYCIPQSEVNKAEQVFQTLVPDLCPKQQRHLLMNQSFLCMIPPQVLIDAGIPVYRLEQQCEEFLVLFPGAALSSISCGYNVAECIHCASPSWLATGVQSFKLSRLLHQSCKFSMDQLLCLLSTKVGSHSNRCMLQVMLTELKAIREREIRLRKELSEAGLKSAIRFDEPESPSRCCERRGKTLAKSVEEKYCHVCKFACYLSMVVNEKEDNVYCLEHGLEQAQSAKTCRNLKLMYRYDEAQLRQVVQDVEETITSLPKLKKSSKNCIKSKAKNSPLWKSHKDVVKSSVPVNSLPKGTSMTPLKLLPDTTPQVIPPRSTPRNSPKGTNQSTPPKPAPTNSPKGAPQDQELPKTIRSPKTSGRSPKTSSRSPKTTIRSPKNPSKPALRNISKNSPKITPKGTPKSSPKGTSKVSPRNSPLLETKPLSKVLSKTTLNSAVLATMLSSKTLSQVTTDFPVPETKPSAKTLSKVSTDLPVLTTKPSTKSLSKVSTDSLVLTTKPSTKTLSKVSNDLPVLTTKPSTKTLSKVSTDSPVLTTKPSTKTLSKVSTDSPVLATKPSAKTLSKVTTDSPVLATKPSAKTLSKVTTDSPVLATKPSAKTLSKVTTDSPVLATKPSAKTLSKVSTDSPVLATNPSAKTLYKVSTDSPVLATKPSAKNLFKVTTDSSALATKPSAKTLSKVTTDSPVLATKLSAKTLSKVSTDSPVLATNPSAKTLYKVSTDSPVLATKPSAKNLFKVTTDSSVLATKPSAKTLSKVSTDSHVFATKPSAKTLSKVTLKGSSKNLSVVTLIESPSLPPTTRSHIKLEPEDSIML